MTFLRRIIAGIYDLFVLASWLMLATFIAVLIRSGEAFPPKHLGFLTYLWCATFLLFGWCWTHGGQTLGMLAWKMKVVRHDNQPLSWKDAFLRFIYLTLNWLCLGIGWLWCWFDTEHQSLHDRLSGTKLIRLR